MTELPDAEPAQPPADPTAEQVPAQPRRRRTLLLVVAGAVVLAVAGTTVAILALAGPAKPTTIAMHGTMSLVGSSGISSTGGGCQGSGGYEDIRAGTQVTVTDAKGTVVAVSSLGGGQPLGLRQCDFPFDVAAVPLGLPFYGVAVSHRGTIQFTEAEVRRGVKLSLGS